MAHARGEGGRKAKPHVLVVEDERLYEEFLQARGFEVTSVVAIQDVVAVARAKKPNVVVLDLGTGLDRCDVARELRSARETKKVAILALTSAPPEEALAATRDAECDECFAKPIRPDDLAEAVERWKGGHGSSPRRKRSSKPPARRLTIGELARRAGVGVETVRFYERKGLMPKAPRAGRRWRDYETDAVEQLRSIRRLRGLGFQTKEIASILTLRTKPEMLCRPLMELLGAKRDDLAVRIRELQASHAALEEIVASCRRVGPLDSCRAVLALFDPNLWQKTSS
jgi:DNA-binding transcriptional MerR regulator/CheY-like chemotaxis protein